MMKLYYTRIKLSSQKFQVILYAVGSYVSVKSVIQNWFATNTKSKTLTTPFRSAGFAVLTFENLISTSHSVGNAISQSAVWV